MAAHRTLRIAEAIRETVATALLFEIADPRIPAGSVTVLRVEVSADLRNAVIFVSFLGSEAEQTLAMRGLKSATGYIQNKVAKQLRIRFVPAIQFKLDDSAKKSVEMSKLIDEALASDRADRPEASEIAAEAYEDDEEFDDENENEDESEDNPQRDEAERAATSG